MVSEIPEPIVGTRQEYNLEEPIQPPIYGFGRWEENKEGTQGEHGQVQRHRDLELWDTNTTCRATVPPSLGPVLHNQMLLCNQMLLLLLLNAIGYYSIS